MDSTLECLVFTLNAIGGVKFPGDFHNISDLKVLKKIAPNNILGTGQLPGYAKMFPKVVACWSTNSSLVNTITEYHDVSKHREAVSTGGENGVLYVRTNPKEPGSSMSSTKHTVQSLTVAYRDFIVQVLPIALHEIASAFGYVVSKKV